MSNISTSSLTAEPIGFIGLGNMGQPLARHLLTAGYPLRVYDRNPARTASLVEFGADPCSNPREAATPSGIVFSMVPDDTALKEITLGPQGVLTRLEPGGVHISMGTHSIALAASLEQEYRKQGATYLSAPVLGRPNLAETKQLSILLSGAPEAMARVHPLLTHLGRRLWQVGEQAYIASLMKLGANFLIAAAIEAMGEVKVLFERYHIDPTLFFDIIGQSLFACPVYTGYGQMIGTDTYEPALFPTTWGKKDLTMLAEASKHAGLLLHLLPIVQEHLQMAIRDGQGAYDWSVLAAFAEVSIEEPREAVAGIGRGQDE